jgi:hypothetical protein
MLFNVENLHGIRTLHSPTFFLVNNIHYLHISFFVVCLTILSAAYHILAMCSFSYLVCLFGQACVGGAATGWPWPLGPRARW